MENQPEQKKEKEIDTITYSDHYGFCEQDAKYFNDTELFGKEALRYKIERIVIYYDLDQEKKVNNIAGMEVIYVNIATGKKLSSGDHVNDKDKHQQTEFLLKPSDYLTEFKLWMEECKFYKFYFKTQTGKEFSVGEEKGALIFDDHILNGKNIILSFLGRFKNNTLASLGYHYISKKTFMKTFLAGFLLVKQKLGDKAYAEQIEKLISEGKLSEDFIYLVKACQLPKTPFSEVLKYCV